MKYKITILFPSLKGGGAERVLLNLLHHLNPALYQFTLLVQHEEVSYAFPPNVTIRRLKSRGIKTILPELVRYLREESPHLFISHMSVPNVVAILAKKLAGKSIPTLLVEHTTPSIKFEHEGGLKRVMPWLIRWTYPEADAIVTVSKGAKEDLMSLLGESNKIHVIYNPIVPSSLPELAEQDVEHPWFNNKDYQVVIAVGRLEEVKNFPLLIESFEQVYQCRPQARLVILGEGPERLKLQEHIDRLGLTDVIFMPGFVSNPYAYLRRSHVLALSSKWEGFGNVLVEALACGIPVVSTDCPKGPREILEGGKYGLLVPPSSKQELAEAIVYRLDHPPDEEERRRYKQRAAEFSIDKSVAQYERLIFSML